MPDSQDLPDEMIPPSDESLPDEMTPPNQDLPSEMQESADDLSDEMHSSMMNAPAEMVQSAGDSGDFYDSGDSGDSGEGSGTPSGGGGGSGEPEGDYTMIYAKDPGYIYWEIMREHLKEVYYSFALFFDIASDYTVDSNLPAPIKTRKSPSGWTVIEGSDYVLITPGITAFEEYGHRKRLLETIDDVCKHELLNKGWITVVAEGVNEWVTSVAWVKMHRDGKVKTTAFAPTELSDQILAKCDVFVEIAPRITAAPSA